MAYKCFIGGKPVVIVLCFGLGMTEVMLDVEGTSLFYVYDVSATENDKNTKRVINFILPV
jgi:hypothetical protein